MSCLLRHEVIRLGIIQSPFALAIVSYSRTRTSVISLQYVDVKKRRQIVVYSADIPYTNLSAAHRCCYLRSGLCVCVAAEEGEIRRGSSRSEYPGLRSKIRVGSVTDAGAFHCRRREIVLPRNLEYSFTGVVRCCEDGGYPGCATEGQKLI